MSGQWEVVGKKKDKSNKNNGSNSNKSNKESNNRQMMKDIKVEEVLPMSKLNKLYGQGKSNKENQKPQAPKQKPVENGAAKKKKPDNKPQQPPKPKPAKSIEGALSALNADEFRDVFENNKALFPDTPIVWLKEMAQFLNKRVVPMDNHDPTFSNKMELYPLSVMPNALRSIIEKAVNESNPSNVNLFFDISLTTMATEMNKDAPVLGHKFFLQYIATKDPKMLLNKLNAYNTLKNSYQNRQNIGLSILWALGQAGLKDFSVGLKVFHEVMYPLMEMKNYSKYVTKYLINLINRPVEGSSLQKDQYLNILDVIHGSKKNVPSELVKELNESASKLNDLLLLSVKGDKYHTLVEPILKKLGTTTENQSYSNQLCEILVALMERDQTSLNSWSKLYSKNLVASASLLEHIDTNWKPFSKNVDLKSLKNAMVSFSAENEEMLTKKRKDAGLLKADEYIQKISKKMVNKKKDSTSFLRKSSVVLTILLCIAVTLDLKQQGSWEKTAIGKALNKTGVADCTNMVLFRAKECTVWMHRHIEEQFPGVTEATVEFTTPYIELGRDLLILFNKFYLNQVENFKARIPTLLAQIDKYCPGSIDQVVSTANNAFKVVCDHYENVKAYLLKDVFVGKMAPERMQKVLHDNFIYSVEKMQEYYQWVYQKIMTAIK